VKINTSVSVSTDTAYAGSISTQWNKIKTGETILSAMVKGLQTTLYIAKLPYRVKNDPCTSSP
jgi:hypothetical protein